MQNPVFLPTLLINQSPFWCKHQEL